MKKLVAPALLLLVATAAQADNRCAADRQRRSLPQARTAQATPEEDWYDVQHVKLDLTLTHTGTAISGSATTTARVTAASLPVYAFELDTTLTIDSFQLNGQTVPVATNGATVRKATLQAPLPQGAVFTARTFYHGQPPAGTGFFTRGLNHFTLTTGTQMTYTLSDMYTAKDWWPAKQDIRDKIDSVDVWLTTPAGTKGCSNGVLARTTAAGSGQTRYEWRHRFPIKYYLISAAVAPYTERAYTMQFPNGDTLRIQNFVYDTAGLSASTRTGLDSLGRGINLFSNLFGRYPFWGEKYGNCLAELGGGMEHQTMTTLGYNVGESTVMHELAHQWWGDCVSQGTWRDIWLSEGFATYCEQLYAEFIYGAAAAKSVRSQVFNSVLSSPGGTVIVSDTTDAGRVFDNRLTYSKGAAVAHMLRQLAPADSLFFKACRQYQQQFQYRNATTADLQNVFQTVYNRPLDTFFQQWVYGQGYPNYTVSWDQRSGMVYLQLKQTASAGASVATFHTPVELQLQGSAGNSVVRVYSSEPVQVFALPYTAQVTNVSVDPNRNTLLRVAGLVTRDTTLDVSRQPAAVGLQAVPNPTRTAWQISGTRPGTALQLRDAGGRVVWQDTATGTTVQVPAAGLIPGTYLLTTTGAVPQHLLLLRE